MGKRVPVLGSGTLLHLRQQLCPFFFFNYFPSRRPDVFDEFIYLFIFVDVQHKSSAAEPQHLKQFLIVRNDYTEVIEENLHDAIPIFCAC